MTSLSSLETLGLLNISRKLHPGYYRNIIRVVGKSTVVSLVYVGIDSKNLVVREESKATRNFILQRTHKQIAASNSFGLGSLMLRQHYVILIT